MYRNILIPTDGSELSTKAIEHGTALAKTLGAKVTALTVTMPFNLFVVEPTALVDSLEAYKRHVAERSARILGVVQGAAAAAGVPCDTVAIEHEHPYRAIIDTTTQRGCDLIVMASHGRRGVSAIVLGSETVKVLTHSAVPVLVCR
jgi:nucleotide-binding universal stress UspA family protein